MLFLLSLAAFLISLAGTRLFIRWSEKRRILDVPNERSSHSRPVPVGAGLIISAVILIGIQIAAWPMVEIGKLSLSSMVVFAVAGIALVAVSWIDDVRSVSVVVRFAVQATAAAGLMFAFRGWTEVMGNEVLAGVAAFLWIVGLTNAYNFMDGIDGIAGVQAVTAGLGWLFIGALAGSGTVTAFGGILTASSVAFLIFNWQPAKVFMGDAGSAFIGFSLAAAPLLLHEDSPVPISAELALLSVALVWPFVFDSSLTFLKRLIRGEKVWKPHRSHIYQRMVIDGRSHARVSLLYGLLGLICTAAAVAVVAADAPWYTAGVAMVLTGTILFIMSVVYPATTPDRSSA